MRVLVSSAALTATAAACVSPAAAPNDERWTVLFDGETLEGWFVHNGDLPYEVRDREIVGVTAVDIPNRYLTTESQYGDFILELEVNNSDGENSGIQFRSVTDAPNYSGLTGYQLEIDPSERAWTGGIYFEGIWTWQHPPINNPACKAAWKPEDWNSLRIEAKGEVMRTFVNDTPCAYLFDEYLPRGHIGLQVHSIGANPDMAGAETRWRNIRILETPKPEDYTPIDLQADSASHLIDRLSPAEEALGWELALPRLVDTSTARLEYVQNPINAEVWTVNVLELEADAGPVSAAFSVPERSYEFIADLQLRPGTEGEVLYPVAVSERDGTKAMCKASYRIFDDRSLEDRGDEDPNLMGSLTNKMAARNLSENGRPKRVLYGDAWRRLGIKVKDGKAEHWLNAVKVVEHSNCQPVSGEPPVDEIELRLTKGSIFARTIKLRADTE